MRIDDVLQRIQGEFVEMPGLRLTPAQAQRLWGLERDVCDALLGALVDAKFLAQTRDGAFVRIEGAKPTRLSGFSTKAETRGRLVGTGSDELENADTFTHRCRPADYLPRQPNRPARHPRSRAVFSPRPKLIEG